MIIASTRSASKTAFPLLDKAVELGGTVALPIMPVPSIGWLCYIKDPNDNIVGMMQSDKSAA